MTDTVLHEVMHAALPDLAEDAVLKTATAQAGALQALGLIASDQP